MIFIFRPYINCDAYISTAKLAAVTNFTPPPLLNRDNKYPFQVKLEVWRDWRVKYDVCHNSFTFNYELELSNNDSRTVLKGTEVDQYIRINNGGLPDVISTSFFNTEKDALYPLAVTFTDKYYTDRINTYTLKIKITVTDFDNKFTTNELLIKPLIIEAKAMRTGNGCENNLNIELKTPGSQGQKISHIMYNQSAKESIFGAPPTSKKIAEGQEQDVLEVPLNKLYAKSPKKIEIIAYEPGYMPALAVVEIDPASGLNISTDEYNTANQSVSVTVSIPDCHKNILYNTPVNLIYDKNVSSHLISSPSAVQIAAGENKTTFLLKLDTKNRCAQTLNIKASSPWFSDTSEVNVALPQIEAISLVTQHIPQKNYKKEHVSVEVQLLPFMCEQNSDLRLINLSYNQAALEHLLEPPNTITLQKGEEKKRVNIYLKGSRCDLPVNFVVSATAQGLEKSDSPSISLPQSSTGGKAIFSIDD